MCSACSELAIVQEGKSVNHADKQESTTAMQHYHMGLITLRIPTRDTANSLWYHIYILLIKQR
jgi:hypothetical protein